MVDYEFWFGGKSSKDAGINLQRPIRFSGADPIRDSVKVAGRNGALHFETHTFENRKGKADCFVMGENAEQKFDDVNAFLFGNLSYQVLQTDEDINHFWLAKVANGADIEVRLKKLAPFSIEFDCMPQRFLVSGNETITVTNGGTITNPTAFTASPIITVRGNGKGALNVAGTVVTLSSINDRVILDCEVQNAYKGTENLNNTITAPEFPVLFTGNNKISWSGGITGVEIIPRWWTL